VDSRRSDRQLRLDQSACDGSVLRCRLALQAKCFNKGRSWSEVLVLRFADFRSTGARCLQRFGTLSYYLALVSGAANTACHRIHRQVIDRYGLCSVVRFGCLNCSGTRATPNSPATLLVVSGSFARADTFSITSSWHTGSATFGSLDTYSGDGTFDWTSGATITNVVFSFVRLTHDTFTSGDALGTLWTAATPANPGIANGGLTLEIGTSGSDCGGTGGSCIVLSLASAISAIGGFTTTGTSGSTQNPNTFFDSATLSDTNHAGTPAIPEPNSVILLLTVLVSAGLVARKKFGRISPAIES
jgi:hypothetical protein